MLHRPAPPRPARVERRPATLAVTGISVARLERLIEEMVERAVRRALATVDDRLECRPPEDPP